MVNVVREKVYFMEEDPELLHIDRAEDSPIDESMVGTRLRLAGYAVASGGPGFARKATPWQGEGPASPGRLRRGKPSKRINHHGGRPGRNMDYFIRLTIYDADTHYRAIRCFEANGLR